MPILPTASASTAPTGAGAAAACAADPNCAFRVQWNTVLQAMFVVHIFGLLWISGFIKVESYCVVKLLDNKCASTGAWHCHCERSSGSSILEPPRATLCNHTRSPGVPHPHLC